MQWNATPRGVYLRSNGKAVSDRVRRCAVWIGTALLVVGLSIGGQEPAVREGIFGISGIIPDNSYFAELRVDVGTSGFWIGASPSFLGGRKEALHTEQMRGFVEHGITPIATFWLGDVGPDAADAAERIVSHYSTGQGAVDVGAPVTIWELGDEQNGTWGTSCEPEEYARRVALLAPAIRRGCPSCRIVLGGLLDGPEMGDWALGPYLDRFLAAGGGAWIDVYAFHYYGLARPHPAWPEAQLYDSAIELVATVRHLLADHGLGDRPIWVTETSTFSGGMGAIEQSESDQAADLVKRYVLLWSLDVDVVQWCYLTEPQFEGTGVGFFDQSGLIYDGIGPYDRGAGVKKRAYFAYLHMIDRLRGAELLDRTTEGGLTVARFVADGEPVSVVWQDPWVRDGSIWVDPAGALVVEDLYGELVGHYDDRFRLDPTLEPVYLIGPVESVSTSAPVLQSPGS